MVTTMLSAGLNTSKTTLLPWASTVIAPAPGPVMVTSSEMSSSPTSWIVPVSPAWKVMVSTEPAALAASIAWRRLPAPLSLRLVTMKPAACEGTAPASWPAISAPPESAAPCTRRRLILRARAMSPLLPAIPTPCPRSPVAAVLGRGSDVIGGLPGGSEQTYGPTPYSQTRGRSLRPAAPCFPVQPISRSRAVTFSAACAHVHLEATSVAAARPLARAASGLSTTSRINDRSWSTSGSAQSKPA